MGDLIYKLDHMSINGFDMLQIHLDPHYVYDDRLFKSRLITLIK